MEKEQKDRVPRLLDDIVSELEQLKKTSNNCNLGSVADLIIDKVKCVRKEVDDRGSKYDFPDSLKLLKTLSHLVDIVEKWSDTLFYKFVRFIATPHKIGVLDGSWQKY